MYDLCTAKPHLPPGARFDELSLRVYSEGYMMALQKALQVMQLAETRWQLVVRTQRLEAKRRREQER